MAIRRRTVVLVRIGMEKNVQGNVHAAAQNGFNSALIAVKTQCHLQGH
jgi:hypothetical protein